MAQAKQQKERHANQTDLETKPENQGPSPRQAGGNQPKGPDEGRGSKQHGMARSDGEHVRGISRLGQQGSMSPFGMMRRFNEEMDRLFEDFAFNGFSTPRLRQGPIMPSLANEFEQLAQWTPQTEVFKRGDEIVVRVELPGMTKDDVIVDLDDDRIVIRGERRDEREANEHGISERSYGSFYRSIPLPEGIDGEKAKADFWNGVLEITLPRPKQKQRGRQLEIGDGGATADQRKSNSR